MKDFSLIIFDMDGLMFDTERISYRTWDEVVTNHGYPFSFEFFKTMVGSNFTRIKELCFKHYGKDFPFDSIMEDRVALTTKIIEAQGVPIKEGLIQLLTYLKSLPVKIAVATSSGRDRAYLFLDHAKVRSFFDYVLCGDEITRSKPDPEIFINVAKKLECDPHKTIVLEDSFLGVEAAFKAEMKPIMVPDMLEPTEEILAMTYKCFKSLTEVKQFFESLT